MPIHDDLGTRMKEFYNQEPLDWRNDNYYCNQIYTMNADNLNVIIDSEFGDRENVIYTNPGNNNEKGKEQEMIGFYIIEITVTDPNKPDDSEP